MVRGPSPPSPPDDTEYNGGQKEEYEYYGCADETDRSGTDVATPFADAQDTRPPVDVAGR